MLFECAATCHPVLADADEEDHKCASTCELTDLGCYEDCFGHLFEDHDHHHEEGNYTNADMDFEHSDANLEEDSTYWGNTDATNMDWDKDHDFSATDTANTDWDNSDASTTWSADFEDGSWSDHDTTNYNAADGSLTNAKDMDGSWLAQVRSRNQLKNRMLLHKNRKPRPPPTVYVYRK